MTSLIFWVRIGFGFFVSRSPNVAISLLFLVGTYALRRAILINQGLVFVGIAYLLVYIGAIAILFLFVVILLDTRNTLIKPLFERRILVFGAGFVAYVPCVLPLRSVFVSASFGIDASWEDLGILSNSLYTEQACNLIITGVVLILALMGAVLFSPVDVERSETKYSVYSFEFPMRLEVTWLFNYMGAKQRCSDFYDAF